MINAPQPGEYSPFAAGYVALAITQGDVIQTLSRSMDGTAAFFKALPADKADFAYAPGKWTVKEALSHMIETERIFAYRALCISRGEQQNLPGFEQNDYVINSEANNRTLADLTDEFKTVRLGNLYFLRSLSTEQADRVGSSNGTPTSVRALAHMMAGHELHHLNIFKEKYLL
jgi:uncharacterized damage-inducible protein DinB